MIKQRVFLHGSSVDGRNAAITTWMVLKPGKGGKKTLWTGDMRVSLSKDSGLGFSEKKMLHHHLTDNSCYNPLMLPVQIPTFPFVHVAMFHLM